MLDGLDQILAWYQSDIRPLFPDTAALFCDTHGHPLKPETVRERLSRLLQTEDRLEGDRFTPHDLRRACATHHYEQGMDLLTVQQLLGHHHIASTMAVNAAQGRGRGRSAGLPRAPSRLLHRQHRVTTGRHLTCCSDARHDQHRQARDPHAAEGRERHC